MYSSNRSNQQRGLPKSVRTLAVSALTFTLLLCLSAVVFAGKSTLGDFVWIDLNGDGVKDAGEPGINGVKLNLYQDGNSDGAPQPGELISTTVTANDIAGVGDDTGGTNGPGFYRFPVTGGTGIVYMVEVDPSNFLPGGPLEGYTYTGNNATNQYDGPNPRVYPVTQIQFDEPNIDFPFAPPMSVGNRVWFDTNNNGVQDASEQGINGVTVQLYSDANNDGMPDDAFPLATTTTAGTGANAGLYLFTQQTQDPTTGAALTTPVGLLSGTYIVAIPKANFNAGGPLAGYHSSLTSVTNAGLLSETAPTDPDDNADTDDNGALHTLVDAYNGYVLSKPITLSPTTEPTGETPNNNNSYTADNSSNLTVDFGFYTVSLGNQVWLDNGVGGGTLNNGIKDGSEPGLAGATVQLFYADGVTPVSGGSVTTLNTGVFTFTGLVQGAYVVKVTPPAGYQSSTDTADTTTPNNNVDDQDNGIGTNPGQAASNPITLVPGGASPNMVDDTTGNTTNATLDFGFVGAVSLGNQIWFDTDNNGTKDAGELGIDGVTVELYRDANNDGVPDDAFPVATATTATSSGVAGLYLFNQQTQNPTTGTALPAPTILISGTYLVGIPASEFAAGGPLAGYHSSLSSVGANGALSETAPADSDTNPSDTDDNGKTQTAGAYVGGVLSLPISLAPNAEPTAENPNNDAVTPDANANLTVDFGFYTLSLNSQVWVDNGAGGGTPNDGTINGTEGGLPGARVELFYSDGTTPVAGGVFTTTATGTYTFNGLAAGDYVVKVTPPPGYQSTTDTASTPTPNDNVDNQDNGAGTASGPTTSSPVTLEAGSIPANPNNIVDNTTGKTTDPTVDFGFVAPTAIVIVKTAGTAPDGGIYRTTPGSVTYTYHITNTGSTYLTSIVITDDMGTVATGDDTVLTSTQCAGLAGPLAPGAGVTCTMATNVTVDTTNVASTTGTPSDSTGTPIPGVQPPTDNDDAIVDVIHPSLAVLKRLANSVEPVLVGDPVTFTIQITNTGDITIVNLPLKDTYNTVYLTYGNATPASVDNNNDGAIDWSNLAPVGGLAPGGKVMVTVVFTANADTTGVTEAPCNVSNKTCNVATIPPGVTVPPPPGPGPVPPPIPVPPPLLPPPSPAPVKEFNPTGVQMAQHNVVMTSNGAAVEWTSENESEIVGYEVYVYSVGAAPRKLTSSMIAAQHSGQATGASYSFTDASVGQGQHTYVVQIMHTDGRTENVVIGSVSNQSFKLFLPVARR